MKLSQSDLSLQILPVLAPRELSASWMQAIRRLYLTQTMFNDFLAQM